MSSLAFEKKNSHLIAAVLKSCLQKKHFRRKQHDLQENVVLITSARRNLFPDPKLPDSLSTLILTVPYCGSQGRGEVF
jgi:hypothetical protein